MARLSQGWQFPMDTFGFPPLLRRLGLKCSKELSLPFSLLFFLLVPFLLLYFSIKVTKDDAFMMSATSVPGPKASFYNLCQMSGTA